MRVRNEIGGYIGPRTSGKPGKWHITRLLGQGAMGAVYEAETVGLRRLVAIKIVAMQSGDPMPRFTREVKNLGEMRHPNIVGLIDAGEHVNEVGDHIAYMVMEHLEGGDVESELEACRGLVSLGRPWTMARDLRQQCEFWGKIAHALTCAHALGIIHRDIKPSNIFLARQADGSIVPKLIDFGIAGVVEGRRKTTKLTDDGKIFGTPHYMPREQMKAEKLGPETDQFALASVIYEMLVGVVPYNPPDPDSIASMQLMLKRLDAMDKGPDPWIDLLPEAIPNDLRELLRTALSPLPERRFTDTYSMCVVLYRLAGLSDPLPPATPAYRDQQTEVLVLPVSVSVPLSSRSIVKPTPKETLEAAAVDTDRHPAVERYKLPRWSVLAMTSVIVVVGMILVALGQLQKQPRQTTSTDAATARPPDVHVAADAGSRPPALLAPTPPRPVANVVQTPPMPPLVQPMPSDERHGRDHGHRRGPRLTRDEAALVAQCRSGAVVSIPVPGLGTFACPDQAGRLRRELLAGHQ